MEFKLCSKLLKSFRFKVLFSTKEFRNDFAIKACLASIEKFKVPILLHILLNNLYS